MLETAVARAGLTSAPRLCALQAVLSSPAVKTTGTVSSTAAAFTPNIAGESSDVALSWSYNDALFSGDTVQLTLEGFTGNAGAMSLAGADAGSFSASAWAQSSKQLTLTVGAAGISGGAGVEVMASTLVLPAWPCVPYGDTPRLMATPARRCSRGVAFIAV